MAQVSPVPQQAGFPIVQPIGTLQHLLVVDLDQDGFQEIVTFATEVLGTSNLTVYDHEGNVKPGWPLTTGDARSCVISAGDIDGDGDLEIAWFTGSQFNQTVLSIADHEGDLLQGLLDNWPAIEPQVHSPLMFVDLNGDGAEEIITYDRSLAPNNHIFYALSANGVFPGWPVGLDLASWPGQTLGNRLIIQSMSAGDFNYDNHYELVVGPERVFDSSDRAPVYRVRGDGTSVSGYPRFEQFIASCSGIIVADFNQDRICEYGGLGDQEFSASRIDGSYYRHSVLFNTQGSLTLDVLGQFDDDEDLELLIQTTSLLIADPWPGAGRPFVTETNPNIVLYNPCVADIDGDGISEIGGLTLGGAYEFVVLDNNLQALPGWPVQLSPQALSRPGPTCAADLDNDGDLEMIVVVLDSIYVFDFPGAAGKVYWSGLHGNYARNRFPDHRNYPNEEFVRGDINSDSLVDVTDIHLLLRHLFVTERHTLCKPRMDVNSNGAVNLADTIHLISALFLGTASIPEPFPQCGKMPAAPYRKLYCLESICN